MPLCPLCVKSYYDLLFVCAVLQMLVAGQGLNDNQWHTLRFSRRDSNLKLQVDDDTPTTGKDLLHLHSA